MPKTQINRVRCLYTSEDLSPQHIPFLCISFWASLGNSLLSKLASEQPFPRGLTQCMGSLGPNLGLRSPLGSREFGTAMPKYPYDTSAWSVSTGRSYSCFQFEGLNLTEGLTRALLHSVPWRIRPLCFLRWAPEKWKLLLESVGIRTWRGLRKKKIEIKADPGVRAVSLNIGGLGSLPSPTMYSLCHSRHVSQALFSGS